MHRFSIQPPVMGDYFASSLPGENPEPFAPEILALAGPWVETIDFSPDGDSKNHEYGAHLSMDGKYLFFTSHGSDNNMIKWVSVMAIDRLKP